MRPLNNEFDDESLRRGQSRKTKGCDTISTKKSRPLIHSPSFISLPSTRDGAGEATRIVCVSPGSSESTL